MATVFEQARTQREQDADDNRRRSAAARAGRSVDRSSGRGAGGRSGGGGSRGRRAPASSSQFHVHAKKSKASGAGKSPKLSVDKIIYDLGLKESDADKERVVMTFRAAPDGTPQAALEPLELARACEARAGRKKYANSNTGQMLHLDVALPNSLSNEKLAALSDRINQSISRKFGVPSFAGVHLDVGNYHLHSSVPLYEIQPTKGGGFKLGDRIDHAKRPHERETLGLPRSQAVELRDLREEIADLIADAVSEDLKHAPDPIAARHTAERWRHGHRTLPQQVEAAANRGDVEFVQDNMLRDATRKEGPGKAAWTATSRDARRQSAKSHNVDVMQQAHDGTIGPQLISKAAVQRVLSLAQVAGITDPEQVRLLMAAHGIKMTWSAGKDKEKKTVVKGVSYRIDDGESYPGAKLGASLGALKDRFKRAETPAYQRGLSRGPKLLADYQKRLEAAGVQPRDLISGAVKSILSNAAQHERMAISKAQAAKAAPLAETAREGVMAPSVIKKAPTPIQAAPVPASRGPANKQATPPATQIQEKGVMDAMIAKKWMTELSTLPPLDDKDTGTSKGKGTSSGAKQASKMPKPPLIAIHPATLTQAQRLLLADEWDRPEARRTGQFGGPLHDAQQRLQDLNTRLKQHQSNQPPLSQQVELQEKKRLFRKPKRDWIDTPKMEKWRAFHDKLTAARTKTETRINDLVDAACRNPELQALLPQLQDRHDAKVARNAAQARQEAGEKYAEALKQLQQLKPKSHEAKALLISIHTIASGHPDLLKQEEERRAKQILDDLGHAGGGGGTGQHMRPGLR